MRRSPPRNQLHASNYKSPYRSTHHRSIHSRPSSSPYSPHLHRQQSPISHKILAMEFSKQKCMNQRRYSTAQRLDKKIRRAKSVMASERVNRLISQQKQERRSISEAHKNEVRYFNTTWHNYFSQLQERESLILRCFKEEQERQVFQAQVRVRRRCRSLHLPNRQIIDLKQKQQKLRKTRDFHHLKYVKKQLAEAILKERREKTRVMEHFAQLQQQRLSMAQSKKYSVLMRRLQQYRRDKERVYLREQKRLRQKYKNVMQKLRHQQTIQFQQTNKFALAMQL